MNGKSRTLDEVTGSPVSIFDTAAPPASRSAVKSTSGNVHDACGERHISVTGRDRCTECSFHVPTQGHRSCCSTTAPLWRRAGCNCPDRDTEDCAFQWGDRDPKHPTAHVFSAALWHAGIMDHPTGDDVTCITTGCTGCTGCTGLVRGGSGGVA